MCTPLPSMAPSSTAVALCGVHSITREMGEIKGPHVVYHRQVAYDGNI